MLVENERIINTYEKAEFGSACEIPFSPVIKKELTEVPLVKQIFECMESIPIDRNDTRQSLGVISEVAERVKKKENCLIFPEGTRSRQGNRLLDFKSGCFKAAVKAKCPIVPVALLDSYKPFDESSIKPATVQVHILDPIPYEEYCGWKTPEIAAVVKKRIEKTIMEAEPVDKLLE